MVCEVAREGNGARGIGAFARALDMLHRFGYVE